jgi:hypothetical protein
VSPTAEAWSARVARRRLADACARRRLLATLLAALSLSPLAPSPTSAQASPRVYVVSVATSAGMEAVATRAGSAARAALRNLEGIEWRGPDQLFLGYEDGALEHLERGRERLAEGRQAYLNLELDQAIASLQSAVTEFEAAATAMEDPSDLGTALLFLGASHAFNGQRRQAIDVFRRLHTQMPHIQPDPDLFNPDVLELYASAAPPDARDPSEVIEVGSDPPGAIAYVDFLARGATPIRVGGLAAGDHVVRVSRPGATPYVETQRVRRGRPASTNAFLTDLGNLEGFADLLPRIAEANVDRLQGSNPISEVATALDLARVGVIRVSSAGEGQAALELLLFDVRSGRRLVRGQGTVPTGIGQLEEGVQRLVSGAFEAALRPQQVADAEAAPVVRQPEPPPAPPPSPGVHEQWWFWTIVGAVVVAGVATGVGVGLAEQGPAQGADLGGQVVFTF